MAKILIVDDNEINRRILVKLLGRHRHKLEEACDGADALEKVNASPPDLVITDMLMPVMDGQELIRQLRAKPNTANLPIIIYSALYLARSAQGFAQTYGVSNILTKPSKPEVIIRSVNMALGLPLHEEDPLEVANQRLEAILEISQQLSSEQNPQRLLEGFCEQARKISGAKCAFIGILDESRQGVQRFFTSGIEVDAARERLLPAARGLLDRVAAERIPLRESGDEINLRSAGAKEAADLYDSLLGVPISTPTRLLGWLCLVDKLGAKEFGEEEARLGGILAAQAALAYENLGQQGNWQRKTEQLEEEIRHHVEPLSIRLKERTRQLETITREHEAFSLFVAKDLRTPLREIGHHSRAMIENHSATLDLKDQHSLQLIFDSAFRMETTINDLLLLSQVGRKELEKTAIDLENLTHTVVGELRKLEPARSLNVKIQALPPTHGDYSMIRQALTSLIANAFKFTRDSTNPTVEIGFLREESKNVYYIKDNGIGFDSQQADKLFTVFQRLHRERDFEGSGIGLALVRRVIDRHGGRIWAESRVDAGATFYFTIPGEQTM